MLSSCVELAVAPVRHVDQHVHSTSRAFLSAHYRHSLAERKMMSLGVASLHESVLCAPVQPQGGKAAGGEAEESPGKYHLSVGGFDA